MKKLLCITAVVSLLALEATAGQASTIIDYHYSGNLNPTDWTFTTSCPACGYFAPLGMVGDYADVVMTNGVITSVTMGGLAPFSFPPTASLNGSVGVDPTTGQVSSYSFSLSVAGGSYYRFYESFMPSGDAMSMTNLVAGPSGYTLVTENWTAPPGTWTMTVTPLPAALPLFASGLAGLGLLGWRRKRNLTAL